MSFSVRPAVTEDIPAITSIYNHYINHSVATFRTTRVEPSVLLDTYCSAQNSQHPFLVAVSHNGTEILGYAFVSGYRASHPAYWHTVELSIYVHPDHLSGGVGSRLWTALEDALRQRNRALVGDKGDSHSRDERTSPGATPIRHVLAVMALDTEGSQGGYGLRDWYVKRGFVQKGHLEEVGYKFGRWIDTIILQLTL